jgi:hypothetical protein
MYILFNLWWEVVLLRSICEQAQNSEPHLIVCVLQVNDSMLVDCHWSAVFLTLSLSCCCWPQLRRAIPAPCRITVLQLLAITPTSCCLRGLRQCCCWVAMASFAPCLVVGLSRTRFRLPTTSLTSAATPQLSGELLGFPSPFSTCFVHRAAALLCSDFVRCGL